MLLVLDTMLRLFDFVAQEGGPVSVVWRMLASLMPEYLSLGIPIGLMLGILLAFRKIALTTDAQEIADLKLSLTDRYGKLPPEAEALLELGEIRCLGEAKGVLTISSQENVLRCEQCNNQGRFEPVLVGNRFPRLTARDPLRKLKEIRQFLLRLPHPFSQ